MKRAPWIAAGVLVVLGGVAVALAPRALPRVRPIDLWGASHGAPGGGTPAAPITAPAQTVYVLEQVSPIVGPDSKLTESLGIEMPTGRFTPVLPKGTPAPVGRIVIFGTAVPDQKEIRLHVLRGRSTTPSENRSLGWVRIPDLPPGPRGATRIAVTFQVVDGAIVLAAADAARRIPFTIEPSEAPPAPDR